MPSQGASATPSLGAQDARLKTALELGSVKFHIKTGNTKWQCTVMDRATHERQKAMREGSSSSISTDASSTSTGSN